MDTFKLYEGDSTRTYNYNYKGFPAYFSAETTAHWQARHLAPHWHEEMEFLAVKSGTMSVISEDSRADVGPGKAIVLLPGRICAYLPGSDEDCEYICTLLHPSLLCSSREMERRFVAPAMSAASAPPFVLLDRSQPWHAGVIESVWKMFEGRESDTAPLLIQSLFFSIWIALYDNVFRHCKPEGSPSHTDRGLAAVREMVMYIQKNYQQKLTLADIAKCGAVCERTCLTLFKKYIQHTPTQYLIFCRMNAAAEMLRSTEMPVTEVAGSCGSPNVSHFIKTFHKIYHCTPLEYRKRSGSGAA